MKFITWTLLEKYKLREKKLAHAYFGRRIFNKSFGGKIRHIWTDLTYRLNKKKKKMAHA